MPPAVNWPQPTFEAGSPSAYSMRKGSIAATTVKSPPMSTGCPAATSMGIAVMSTIPAGVRSLAGGIVEQKRACEGELRGVGGGQRLRIAAETSRHGRDRHPLIEQRDARAHRIEHRVAALLVEIDVDTGRREH